MFIIVGTMQLNRSLGWVADYCPICREVRTCRVYARRHYMHLFYVPFMPGKIDGHLVKCECCKYFIHNRIDDYIEYHRRDDAPLEQLIEETNPKIEESVANLWEIEARADDKDLAEEDRRELIQRSFSSIAFPIQMRAKSYRPSLATLLFGLLTLASFIAFVMVFGNSPNANPGALLPYITSGISAISLMLTFYSVHRAIPRYIERHFQQHLVESLLPLDPTDEELKSVLKYLKNRNIAVGQRIKAKWVRRIIEEAKLRK